jgi:CubicO group peptidase (beta-lactamase class C family)/ketosteroid isomerase-like protein
MALSISTAVPAQTRTPPRQRFPADLDRYIQNVLRQWQIPGLAIAVVRNDSVLVAKGYGVRELGKPGRVDQNTVFDIASLSKSFTATATAILVDRGKLHWDDPVRRYLPDLVLPTDSLTQQLTLRDFLSHRTGLDPANMMWVPTAVDRAEVLRRMRYVRPVVPPRRQMVYSNIGYTVAGEAAAAAAHLPFEGLLRDLVIQPLGLTRTTWSYEQAAGMENVAAPHATIDGRQQPIARETQRQAIAPAAAVQSSVLDMARWMRLHLNDGLLHGKRFVSESTMREMHRIQVPIFTTPAMRAARFVQDSAVGYGLGWQIMDYRGHPLRWHTGNGDGQIAYMALLPRDRLGIVVLVNTWSAPNVHLALVNRIMDTYLGFAPRDWAGEALARLPAQDRARQANARALVAMRVSAPPPMPLDAYAGRYEHPVFGPVWIRREGSGLTFQMGEGEIADLEYHGANTFYLVWRRPLFRENYGTHVSFTGSADSVVALTALLNRDQFTARKAASAPPSPRPDLTGVEAIVGRWNLRVLDYLGPNDVTSSWLEIERSGFEGLVGRFVGLIGGARPIGSVDWDAKQHVGRFRIPMEWEAVRSDWDVTSRDLRFEVQATGDSLVGRLVRPEGTMRAFVGKRAPMLLREKPTAWSAPVALFNGKDFTGWIPAPTARSLPNYWVVRDGVLATTTPEGANLMTVQRFQDFQLHVEFRLPKGGTGGIFPRGRYWIILGTRPDTMPFKGTTGAVHGFLIPNENAQLRPDIWQAIDVTMVGRRITVTVNGETVIADQIIPGITGSAIDSDEAAPGPIMVQGEESSTVEYRNITISVPDTTATHDAGLQSCAGGDSAVRARLAEWVRQANRGDRAGMNEVWAPRMVGWFPSAPVFGDSAAYAATGLPSTVASAPPRTSFDVVIDDVAATDSLVVVHDLWTERRTFGAGKSVTRKIRGSELWRCQPDGRWRIARYVSAPEAWTPAPP